MRKFTIFLMICFILFTGINFIKPVAVMEAEPVLIDGALLIVVGAVLVIAGYYFATDEDVQQAATDFYNNAPEATRQKMYDIATSPEFVAGVSLIAMDMDMIEDVKDYYIWRMDGIKNQVSAFSRWWNAQFDIIESISSPVDYTVEGHSLSVTKSNTVNSTVYGHAAVKSDYAFTQEDADSWNSWADSWVISHGEGFSHSTVYANSVSGAVDSCANYEESHGDLMPPTVVISINSISLGTSFTYLNGALGYSSFSLGILYYPSTYIPREEDNYLGGTVIYPTDITFGREGVLKQDPDENRLGTATYPYTELEVNSPSSHQDLVNTRIIDVPYTEAGTAAIPWGGTVSGIPMDSILTGEGDLVITEPIAETVELEGNSINFDSYRANWQLMLNKFPFCIPFDLANAFVALFAEAESPLIEVDLTGGGQNVFVGAEKFELDFSIFDGLIKVVHWGILIAFNIGLILITRRLIRG